MWQVYLILFHWYIVFSHKVKVLWMFTLDSVLSAVSRVFRDDWKKSIELSTNIVYIFFCLSTFSQFHAIIAHYKVNTTFHTVYVTSRNTTISLQVLYSVFWWYRNIVYLCSILCMQVGSLCMQVVEHEIKRYDSLSEEVEKKKKRGTWYQAWPSYDISACLF